MIGSGREWQWAISIINVIVIGLLFWLQSDLLRVTGGSLMLVVAVNYIALQRYKQPNSAPLLLSFVALYSALFVLNVLARAVAQFGWEGIRVFILVSIPYVAGLIACIWIFSQFLPSTRRPRDFDQEAMRVWRATVSWLFGALIAAVVAWAALEFAWPSARTSFITVAITIVAAFCLAVGYTYYRSSPMRIPEEWLPALVSRLFWVSVLCTVIGSTLEIMRGRWILWSATSVALVVVSALVYRITLHQTAHVHSLARTKS